jgi:hypothetical protein
MEVSVQVSIIRANSRQELLEREKMAKDLLAAITGENG